MSEAALDQIRKYPSLSEFCEPLPKLIDAQTADVSRSISRFGELLGTRQKQPVSLGFHIIGDTARSWLLQIGPQGSSVSEETAENGNSVKPDIEVVTSEKTWRRIAEGTISPMSAMIAGQLRFRGNVVLASHVVQELRRTRTA
jgi:SCP-2 sterol transfer family protein